MLRETEMLLETEIEDGFQPKIEKVLVLFKSHLDVGFTDFSENVINKYVNEFIPAAMETADTLEKRKDNIRFKWTTGSWLIHEYLTRASADKLPAFEKAIRKGKICYHGLPFTMHTEIMTKELFEYGLGIAKRFDLKYKKQTIAAKMTDVPGHTRAIVPLLKNAGIEFLHIGVNEACPVPKVPKLFRWKEGEDEIVVMYADSYGKFSIINGTTTAVYFAHAEDNKACPTAFQVVKLFNKLKSDFPRADIVAADLNDVALEIRPIADTLPVVTQEIGDTWIHGTGTDPRKMFNYKNLMSFGESLYFRRDADKINDALLLTAEHTWGLDEKTFLKDYENFAPEDFDKARTKKNYKKMEKSWQEQRDYVLNAVAAQSIANQKRAEDIMAEYSRLPFESILGEKLNNETIHIHGGNVAIRFNKSGAVNYLSVGGKLLADTSHVMGQFSYEQFSVADYDRYLEQYVVRPYDWAVEDQTKIGMQNGSGDYACCKPKLLELYKKDNKYIAQLGFGDDAIMLHGCPQAAELIVTINEKEIEFDFAWFDKRANRVAEAMWLQFFPVASTARVSKLGTLIDPVDTVENGGRKICGTDFGMVYDKCKIQAVDSALISLGKPALLNYDNTPPENPCDAYFNLYNNVWGTNFPMWYDEDARFRFVLTF